jgi:hypothetical protein
LRPHDSSNRRDIGKLLDGILLGTIACILLYTAFGLVLVRIHADMIAAKMEWFLLNDMRALIAPNDPYLQSFCHQLGSALFFGVTLGTLTALFASAVSIVPWARGDWGKPVELLLTLLLIPVYLFFMFSEEIPVLSVLWAVLTPLFFWIPWMYAQSRRESKRRNRLRLALFALPFLLPFVPLNTLSALTVRNMLMGLPAGNLLSNFYYDHTLLAAHVIKPVLYQAQKVIAISQDLEVSEPLPSGTLLLKHRDPCALPATSLVISKTGLDCPSFLLSNAGAEPPGQVLIRKASEMFDRNKAMRRGTRWFFKGGFLAALLLLIARFVLFLEDVYGRRKGIALLLFAVALVLPSRSLYNSFLLHSLNADSNTRAHEYASSTNAMKRYFSLVHCSTHLPYETLALLSRDPNPMVRHYAFVAMTHQRDPILFSALKEGVSDPEQIVRTKVYQALGEIGDEEAVGLLDRAIAQDPSWYARDYAYKARGGVERIYKIVEQM